MRIFYLNIFLLLMFFFCTSIGYASASTKKQPAKDIVSLLKELNCPSKKETHTIDKNSSNTITTEKKSQSTTTNWVVEHQLGLKSVLYSWAQKAGWTLIWDSNYYYKLYANANFKGSFINAISSLFASLTNLSPQLYVKFYPANKVLLVSNKNSK